MNINLPTFSLRVTWIAFLLAVTVFCSCSHAFGKKSIMIYGQERSSSNQVLALVDLPVSESDEDEFSELSYTVIARGVSNPSYVDGGIVYWRNSLLWLWKDGKFRQLLPEKTSTYTISGPVVGIANTSKDAKQIFAWMDKIPSGHTDSFKTSVSLYSKSSDVDDFELKVNDTHAEPIGWVSQNQLVVRKWLQDPIGRTTESHLDIVEIADNFKGTSVKRLNYPSAGLLELQASTSLGKIAYQTYDISTKKFGLWIKKSEFNATAQRIPIASHPTRGTDFYTKSFEFSSVRSMKWNPSGRYLEIDFPSRGVSLWDDKEKKWLSWGSVIIFEPSSFSSFITWNGDETVYVSDVMLPFM